MRAFVQLLADLLEQHRHQFHGVVLLGAELGGRGAGGLARVELQQQLLAQALRAAQFAAGVVGDLGQVLLQGAQGGLQFLLAGGTAGRLVSAAALADALPRQQVTQGLQYLDGGAGAGTGAAVLVP